jgi:hypothetical protein
MLTDPPPPRRKWHLKRWFTVLVIAIFAWSGWRVYAYRSAIKEAEALGWLMNRTDPSEAIRANWRNAFRKETWTDGVTGLAIPTSEAFEQHLAVLHRLNPTDLHILDASTLRNPSSFSPLTRLRRLWIILGDKLDNIEGLAGLPDIQYLALSGSPHLKNIDALEHLSTLENVILQGSTGLTNLDALKNLSALQEVDLRGCTGLTNTDTLKNLSALKWVDLTGCTGLTRESVEALKAALPNTIINWP